MVQHVRNRAQALVAVRSSSFWNEAIAGALLLAAIAFDRWLALRVARGLRTAEGAHRDLSVAARGSSS